MGRITAIKINVVPRLLFFFTHMLVKIPYKMLTMIQTLFNKFIWGFRKSRLRNEILQCRVEDGGLAIPNVITYYHAALLSAICC